MADIDDVHQEVGFDDFLEGGFESFDQPVGQFADETRRYRTSRTFWLVGRRSRRVVGSSVAKSLSSARARRR
jgi:hypothetical protein